MKALELADTLEAVSIDPGLCHHTVFKDILNAAAELRRLAAVEAESDALKAELEGRYQSIIEMGNMLTEIVNLIRGEPEEGTSHSTHDAVDLVRGLKAEIERIKAVEPVAWLHIPKVALDGKVRPVASTMKYDDDYGAIYSERIPLYALGSKTA